MASLKGLSLVVYILILVTVVHLLPAEARESQFFSKMVRGEPLVGTTAVLPEVSSTAVVGEAAKLPPQSRHGYGLYGHRSNQLPTTSMATRTARSRSYDDFEDVPSNDKFSMGRYPNFDPNAMYTNYAVPSEQYGMSDTRYLDNGRYFYDLNAARSRDDQYHEEAKAGYNINGGKGDGYEYNVSNDEPKEFHNGIENHGNGDQFP